jgi:hypothetical protein
VGISSTSQSFLSPELQRIKPATMSSQDKAVEHAKRTAISYAMDWGSKVYLSYTNSSIDLTQIAENPLPPTLLATLITALHARPFQPLPMLFPPVLLFSTYLNLASYTTDSAGLTAAWSGLYLLLARRRKVADSSFSSRMSSKFGARGLTRGAAMALAGVNVVGGGLTFAFDNRKREAEQRGD